jgi:hypothetical protein
MFWINLAPDSLRVHRIALLGGNVHMLYVAEMAQNSRFLLLLTIERPKNFRLAENLSKKGVVVEVFFTQISPPDFVSVPKDWPIAFFIFITY